MGWVKDEKLLWFTKKSRKNRFKGRAGVFEGGWMPQCTL